LKLGKLSGLLLRHAVDGTKSPDEIHTVNANDAPARKQIREDIQG
jgi:hypothetical protein